MNRTHEERAISERCHRRVTSRKRKGLEKNDRRANTTYRTLRRIIWNIFTSPSINSWRGSRGRWSKRISILTTPINDVARRHNRCMCCLGERRLGSSSLFDFTLSQNNSGKDWSNSLSDFRFSWICMSRWVRNIRKNINNMHGHLPRRTTISISSWSNLWWRLGIDKNRQVLNCFWERTFNAAEHRLSRWSTHKRTRRWRVRKRHLWQQRVV